MKVAAVQASPVFLDSSATTEKVIALMGQVSKEGAELCAFPEVFVSGYPFWISRIGSFKDELAKRCYAAYIRSALEPTGPELAAVKKKSADLGLFVYLGFIEKAPSGGTVYCSLAAIHPERGIVGIHRKLKPTRAERMIWDEGDAHGLKTHEYKEFKVGGLLCFENWQPLLRHTLYAQGEHLHIMVWPGRRTHAVDVARFVAQEGRVFVVSAHGTLNRGQLPDDFPLKHDLPDSAFDVMSGGSMIVDPTGKVLAGPVEEKECVIYADVELDRVLSERDRLDPAGHYARPDLFTLLVRDERSSSLRWAGRE